MWDYFCNCVGSCFPAVSWWGRGLGRGFCLEGGGGLFTKAKHSTKKRICSIEIKLLQSL